MSSQRRYSTTSKSRLSRVSADEQHPNVLREVVNKSYIQHEESDELGFKLGLSYARPSGSQSSRKTGHRQSMPRKLDVEQFSSQPSRTQHKRYSTQSERPSKPYTRPTGPEIVRPHIPSSASLPQNWTSIHDRFIAYLATHAPLTENGKIPKREEFHNTIEIVTMVRERFPRLGGQRLRSDAVEKRLILLDQAGDNDYFDIRYGAYSSYEWGQGI
ncbi:hypothetical protein BJ878DRAFT_568707 [Calycina marina]|uniref:Uncharacterized protein n=1 Tax=Calycina marina TaxID=1763456 RepID=A0A9P7Z1F4_9HELO|nr:hypothetical protein BJ878DRAFT_568707 [Calycina marina]